MSILFYGEKNAVITIINTFVNDCVNSGLIKKKIYLI